MMQGLMNPQPGDPAGGGAAMPPATPQGAAPPQQAQGGMQGGGMPGEPRQASPEQQAAYERTVVAAMDLIYNKDVLPGLLEMLQGGGDPVDGLAMTTAQVFARVALAGEEAGESFDGDILFNAGAEIFNQLADVSDAAGIGNFAEDRDALEAAYFGALDQVRGMMQQGGRIDQEAAQRDLGTLQQMSESGQLEQMLRGLAQNDPRMQRREPANENAVEGEPAPRRGLMG